VELFIFVGIKIWWFSSNDIFLGTYICGIQKIYTL